MVKKNETAETNLKYYSFFTKYSLMDDYGFSSGLFSRFSKKILYTVPLEGTFEQLLHQDGTTIKNAIDQINFETIKESQIAEQLNLSIQALGAKVLAFGLDNRIKAHYDTLKKSTKPFELTINKLGNLQHYSDIEIKQLATDYQNAKTLIQFLRKNKSKIGTNLHLTVTTRRILEYIDRIQELLDLKLNLDSKTKWEKLIHNYFQYSKQEYSIRRFIGRHIDLVALEIVEHNANKGEKYIAESNDEYWRFFRKSLLGGGIISIFALFKICIDNQQYGEINNALYYSLNYAFCFIIVKQFGGIIATKQPAVTASRLAKGIDENDDLRIDAIQNIIELIRRVSRSQFISIIGNFLMAILFAMLITGVLRLLDYNHNSQIINSDYLIKNTVPSAGLIFYAAIAGCFLALSGLISGYVDNKIVASKVSYRIRNSKRFNKSVRFAKFIENKSGALLGNFCLGIFLGSAFLFSYLVPISIDIRHIAFSSANIGFSIMQNDQSINYIFLAIIGALLIGLVNFLVSFTITILLALKSRNASFSILPQLLMSILKDFLRNPLEYYRFKKPK